MNMTDMSYESQEVKAISKVDQKRKIYVKDPMSAFTHFLGIILSVTWLIILVHKSVKINNALDVLAFGVYGISSILLYTASTVYHSVSSIPRVEEFLRKIDHSMIFILIAGTYTPLCMIALEATKGNRLGLSLLIAVWTIAVLGIIFKFLYLNAPRWLYTVLYVVMGWVALFVIVPLYHILTTSGFIYLFLGGVLYTTGAVIYGFKNPKLGIKGFGFHEIFHVFILLGSFAHFLMMLTLVG